MNIYSLQRSVTVRRLIVLVGMGVLLLIVIYSGLSVFTIQNVEVKGVLAQITIDKTKIPKNLLFFPSDQVEKDLITAYPELADVVITKQFPSTLVVTVTPRKPIARVVSRDRSIAVDETGLLLYETADAELPVIELPEVALQTGKPVTYRAFPTILSFINTFASSEIQRISMLDPTTIVVILEKTTVTISALHDGTDTARALQSVLSGFRIKGSQPQTIDLRFAKPVVTF